MKADTDEYILAGYEDLEISTQIIIRDALARGLEVEVLDRQTHFLRLRRGDHAEFIKEASKTRLDSYITFLLMEDKFMSKLVLSEAGLRVPPGKHYHRPADALADLAFYGGRPIVVKPTTTNFGTGITVLHDYDAAAYERAVETAFRFGSAVIVEQFVAGMEYRFLVIGGECVAVANRIPANVQGDGASNIRELVTRKNEDPRRGVGHVTPLEKIQLGDTELDFLASQGLSPDSVPAAGERVFLRRNSNISTGGDSLDCTDEVASGYRELAVRAAGSAGAQICGVDIIAPDLTAPPATDNYAILEINFNPVLYIHNFPYQGKNRQVGEKILDLLGY